MPICHSPLLPYCSISHILFTYTTQRLCPQLSHSMSLKGITCKYTNVDNIKSMFLLSPPFYKITLLLIDRYVIGFEMAIFSYFVFIFNDDFNERLKSWTIDIPENNQIRIKELFAHNCWYTKHDEKLFTLLWLEAIYSICCVKPFYYGLVFSLSFSKEWKGSMCNAPAYITITFLSSYSHNRIWYV